MYATINKCASDSLEPWYNDDIHKAGALGRAKEKKGETKLDAHRHNCVQHRT